MGVGLEEMQNLFDDAGYAEVRKETEALMRARPGKVKVEIVVEGSDFHLRVRSIARRRGR
jgi:hypothetical protein